MYRQKKNAFTLIELLVVIAIIALLTSIVTPSLRRARDIARETVCMTNLRSSGLAAILYAEEMRYLPGSGQWFISIAPYLSQPLPDNFFAMNRDTMPGVFFCPDDPMPYPKPYMGGVIEATSWFVNGAETDFAMGQGLKIGFGLFGGRGRLDRIRSASACMLFGETANYGQVVDVDHPSAVQTLQQANASVAAARIRFHHRVTSRFSHRGRMNIGYADGHVGAMPGGTAEPWPMELWPGGALMDDSKPFYPTLSLPSAIDVPHFWGPSYPGGQVIRENN